MTRTLLLSLCALAAGCAGDAGDAQDVATDDSPSPAGGPVVVEERWMSPADTAWDLDTPATWQNGGEAVVLVTGKATHQLHAFDAATGEAVGTIGSPGSGVGEFRRPNGIAVLDDLVFVNSCGLLGSGLVSGTAAVPQIFLLPALTITGMSPLPGVVPEKPWPG